MFRKLVSITVALIVMLTIAVVPVSAVDTADKALTSAQVEDAVETAVSAIVDADSGSQVELSDEFAEVIAKEADTPREISRAVAQFVFVDKNLVGEISDRIVDECEYTVIVRNEKGSTVYVAINVIENPEIYDARVFLNVVNKMVKRCDELAAEEGIDITGDNYNPMSYGHLAGELALHMILADLVTFAGGGSWNTLLDDLYNHIVIADLDVYEDRFPVALTEFIGRVIIAVFSLFFGE